MFNCKTIVRLPSDVTKLYLDKYKKMSEGESIKKSTLADNNVPGAADLAPAVSQLLQSTATVCLLQEEMSEIKHQFRLKRIKCSESTGRLGRSEMLGFQQSIDAYKTKLKTVTERATLFLEDYLPQFEKMLKDLNNRGKASWIRAFTFNECAAADSSFDLFRSPLIKHFVSAPTISEYTPTEERALQIVFTCLPEKSKRAFKAIADHCKFDELFLIGHGFGVLGLEFDFHLDMRPGAPIHRADGIFIDNRILFILRALNEYDKETLEFFLKNNPLFFE